MRNTRSRFALVASCVLALASGAHEGWAQGKGRDAASAYPERPIRFLVAFAPGGNTDILARAVGARISENWGKPVVVDNRPGGAGVVATEIVVKEIGRASCRERWEVPVGAVAVRE